MLDNQGDAVRWRARVKAVLVSGGVILKSPGTKSNPSRPAFVLPLDSRHGDTALLALLCPVSADFPPRY